MDKLIRYLPDETGKNQDNLVRNESHHLSRQVRGRVIVPRQGSFFGESVVIRDKLTGKELKPIIDFVSAGLRVKHTKLADGPIYAFIIVTNQDCSTDIEIDYQVYGNDIFQFVEPAIELLQESFETNEGIPMAKLLKLPKDWKPTFHYHDLGNIDKFDYMLFSIEKIRNSLLTDNQDIYRYLVDFEKMVYLLSERSLGQFEASLFQKMYDFKKAFNKDLYRLGRLNNVPTFAKDDGTLIASRSIKKEIIENNEAMLNMAALDEFAKKLFEIYVNIGETGIGSSTEFIIDPTIENFEKLPIGSIFTIVDYNFAALASFPDIDQLYPDRTDRANGYVVRKITDGSSTFGSLYLYTGRSVGRSYVLRIPSNRVTEEIKFRNIANQIDYPSILTSIQEHTENTLNPHMDDKRDVNLSQVENLPLATKEDIFCNMPVRKYLTVEHILHYMKRFKTGKKDAIEIFSNLSEKSVAKQMQTIYSPCGAWEDNLDLDKIELCRVIEVPATTLPPPEPVWTVVPDVLLVEITIIEDVTNTTTETPIG